MVLAAATNDMDNKLAHASQQIVSQVRLDCYVSDFTTVALIHCSSVESTELKCVQCSSHLLC